MLLEIDPGLLRLPPEREDGPDPFRLSIQVQEFGASMIGMPLLLVTEGMGGEYMINDGVTRASRVYQLCPGQKVRAEVIENTNWDLSGLSRVKDVVFR